MIHKSPLRLKHIETAGAKSRETVNSAEGAGSHVTDSGGRGDGFRAGPGGAGSRGRAGAAANVRAVYVMAGAH
jgi:hypothetical protein